MSNSTKKQHSTKNVELNSTVLGTENSTPVQTENSTENSTEKQIEAIPSIGTEIKGGKTYTKIEWTKFWSLFNEYLIRTFNDKKIEKIGLDSFPIESTKYELLFNFCAINNFSFYRFGGKCNDSRLPKGKRIIFDGTPYAHYLTLSDNKPESTLKVSEGIIQYRDNLFRFFSNESINKLREKNNFSKGGFSAIVQEENKKQTDVPKNV